MGLKSLLRLQRSERALQNPESGLQPAPIVMVNSIHDAFPQEHSLHTEYDDSIVEIAPKAPSLPKCSIQCIIETDEIESLVDVKYQMMAHSIYQQQRINKWTLSLGGPSQGVVLQGSGHRYFSAPEELGQTAMPLVRACERLNVTVCSTNRPCKEANSNRLHGIGCNINVHSDNHRTCVLVLGLSNRLQA